MTRPRWPEVIAASLLLGGCADVLGVTDFEFNDPTSSATEAPPDAAVEKECVTDADCPGEDTTCQVRRCEAGACGTKNMNAGALCGPDRRCNEEGACVGPAPEGLLDRPEHPSRTVGVEPQRLAAAPLSPKQPYAPARLQ